jgi:outer membrane protein assembly factor BamB
LALAIPVALTLCFLAGGTTAVGQPVLPPGLNPPLDPPLNPPGNAPANRPAEGAPVPQPLVLPAVAPPPPVAENPVFVNDSPIAAEALSRLSDHIAAGNLDQGVTLAQRLLNEDAWTLVPSSRDPALYVTVRTRVHEALRSEPGLMARYRTAQASAAEALLAEGTEEALLQLERTRYMTEAGFEASLRLAQRRLERALFDDALATLTALSQHPDTRGQRARSVAELALLLSRYLDHPERVGPLMHALEELGASGLPEPSERVAPPRSAAARGRSGLQPGPPVDLSGVVSRPLASALYTQHPAPAMSGLGSVRGRLADGQAGVPDSARELHVFPLLSGESVFVPAGLSLICLDRFTLQERWRVTPGQPRADSAQAFDDDRLRRFNERLAGRSAGLREDIATLTLAPGPDEGILVGVLTGDPGGPDDGVQRVVSLDARTGQVRWARPVQGLAPELVRAQARGPVLVHGSTAVLSLRKWQSERRLTAAYLAGVDLHSGRLLWVRLIGSAGSLPYFTTPKVADGATLHEGVVYRSDRIGIVAAYRATDGEPLWVRRLAAEPLDTRIIAGGAWQMNLPVVVGPWLFALAPDRQTVLKLDRADGRVLGVMPADRLHSPAYLVAVGQRVAGVGDARVAFVDAEGFGPGAAVTSTEAFAGAGIRGRVVVHADRLVVPLAGALAVVDPADPARVRAIPIDQAGNVLAAHDQLLIVDDQRVHSHLSWQSADRVLTERIEQAGADLTPAVTLADVAVRADKPERMLFAIEAAVRAWDLTRRQVRPETDEWRRAEAQRRRLFVTLAALVRAAQDAGAERAPAGEGVRSPAVITRVIAALERLADTPPERAAQRLMHAADLVWRRRAAEAAAVLQALIADPELSTAQVEGEGGGRGIDVASRRLERLLAAEGRAVYAAFDAEARAAFAELGAGATAVELEQLARRYPAAQVVPEIYLRCAELLAREGRARAEARALELGLQACDRLGLRTGTIPAELAGRLVDNLARRGLTEAAYGAFRRARARFPGLTFTALARTIDETSLGPMPATGLQLRLGPPVGARQQSLPGWVLLEPAVPHHGTTPGFIVVQSEAGRVALVALPEDDGPLQFVWTSDVLSDPVRLLQVDPSGATFSSTGPAGVWLWRVARDGRMAWRSEPFPELLRALTDDPRAAEALRLREGDATPLITLDGLRRPDEVIVTGDARLLAMLDRRGRAVVLDAASGQVRYTGLLPAVRIADARLTGGTLIVVGDAPPPPLDGVAGPANPAGGNAPEAAGPGGHVVLVIDAASGQPRRSVRLVAEGEGASARGRPEGLPVRLSPFRWLRVSERGDVYLGLSSSVIALDPETGQIDWSLENHPASRSLDAWLVRDRLVVLGEDRSIWTIGGVSGQPGAAPLDTLGRYEPSQPVEFLALPEPTTGAAASPATMVMRGSRGVVFYDDLGGVVGADALGGTESFLTPITYMGGVALLAAQPEGLTEAQATAPFLFHRLDTRSGAVLTSTPIVLPAAPTRVAALPERLVITAGRGTIVLRAPDAPAPAP